MSRVNATPLNATVISEMLPTHTRDALDIVVLDVVGSTNDVVRDGCATGGCQGLVVFAEQQTAGRGRRGKTWHSPAGANIYCSVGWQCEGALASLSGLSLAVGAILAESVAAHLGIQLQLKWPNDLFYQERKLGGVLVELLGEQDGGHNAVIGFGLNVSMGRDDSGMIGRPWTDLATASGSEVDRNLLAADILGQLVSGLTEINHSGMSKWLEAWRPRDMLLGRAVVVDGTPPVSGIAAGIDDSGGLLLHTETGHCTVAGGEVSVLQIGDAI